MEIETRSNQAKRNCQPVSDFDTVKWEIVREKTESKLTAGHENSRSSTPDEDPSSGKLAKRGINIKTGGGGSNATRTSRRFRATPRQVISFSWANRNDGVSRRSTGFLAATAQVQGDDADPGRQLRALTQEPRLNLPGRHRRGASAHEISGGGGGGSSVQFVNFRELGRAAGRPRPPPLFHKE